MFSAAPGRVVRLSHGFSVTPTNCFVRVALIAAQQPAFRPAHQRRLSSSKPSIPPSNKKKPADLDQSATAELQGSEKKPKEQRKSKEQSTGTSGSNLPFVPPTNHLREDDVKISAFFGGHRPISTSRSFPNVTSMAEFDALFDVGRLNEARTIQATNTILAGFLDRVNAEIDVQEEQRADAIESAQDVYHLDAVPTQQSIESWVARLVPFSPPAAPVSLDSLALAPTVKTYSAQDLSATINQRTTEVSLPSDQVNRPQTFREHVARRRFGMLLISVKRQRKLKMKKHKYKKLMKRTRLERRKLDRL